MILHVDMDAFYASIEIRDRPELAGLPVIVGGTPDGRGVVAAASYEARKYGVQSAQSAATALRRCPHAVVIRPRMSYYAQVSRQIFEILQRFTPLVEPLSLDEAFLDVTGCESLFGDGPQIARRIKQDVRSELGLVASVGVAPNKFLAKIASDLQKPDALVVVESHRVQDFLDPLPVGRLWGVGRVTGAAFQRLKIETVGQVRQLPVDVLRQEFGESGAAFWELAQGRDDRPVIPDREAKSISHETTFPCDVTAMDILRARLLELTELVGERLRRQGLCGRTVQLKVRFADFTTVTRAISLPHPTQATETIWKSAADLLTQALPRRRLIVRLIGVGLHNLAPQRQQVTLFPELDGTRLAEVDQVTDQIRAKFGRSALRRGANITREGDRQ